MDEKTHAILIATQGFPISLNNAAKLLRKGKPKVREMIGTRIGIVKGVSNNSYALNLSDVLNLIGKN